MSSTAQHVAKLAAIIERLIDAGAADRLFLGEIARMRDVIREAKEAAHGTVEYRPLNRPRLSHVQKKEKIHAVGCPRCKAAPGDVCRAATGRGIRAHSERMELAGQRH